MPNPKPLFFAKITFLREHNFQQLKQSIDVSIHVHDVNGQIPVDASFQKKLDIAEHCFDARFEKTDANFLPQPLLPSIAEPKHNECEKPVDFYLQQFDYRDSTQCLKTATSSVGDRVANKDAIINLENHLVNLFDPENEIDNCFIGTIPHPFFIPHHFELLERYNRKIWENPPLKLCERALVTNNEEVITWADLLTIDASPADSIHARIQEHFKTNGGKGWLSTNVVNAYSFAAVRLRNTALGFEKFGFLDCNTTTKILSGNYKSGRVTKSLVKDSSRMLRNDLLFPVIYRAHFMLIWFSKKDSHFIIFDSLSQKHSFLLNGINQHLYPFLNSVEPIARVKVAERCLVAQRDSISCGVCVCMTVDALLFEKRNYLNLDYHFINNFRFWITYFLIINSGKNRLEFNKYVKFDFCKGVVGL